MIRSPIPCHRGCGFDSALPGSKACPPPNLLQQRKPRVGFNPSGLRRYQCQAKNMPSPQPRFYLWPGINLHSSHLASDPAKLCFDLTISLVLDGLMTEWCGTLEPDSKLSLSGLANLLSPPSQDFLFTCHCGDAGCGGYRKPVRSEIQKTEFSEYIRLDDFEFHFRNHRGELVATPTTVFFLTRDVRDLVSTIARTVLDIATKHSGQLSGQYDESLRDFLSEYLDQPAPPLYTQPNQ